MSTLFTVAAILCVVVGFLAPAFWLLAVALGVLALVFRRPPGEAGPEQAHAHYPRASMGKGGWRNLGVALGVAFVALLTLSAVVMFLESQGIIIQ